MMEGEEEHLWCLESAVMATGTQLTAALRLIIKQQIDTPLPPQPNTQPAAAHLVGDL